MARLLVVLALLLAGCTSTAPPAVTLPSQTPSSPSTPSPSASSTTPASDPVTNPVAIKVIKTGGFIGIHTEISVDPTGKWNRDGGTGRFTAAQLAELHRLAADPHLPAEANATQPPNMCNDDFKFTVIVGKVIVHYSDCTADSFQPRSAMRIADFVLANTVS